MPNDNLGDRMKGYESISKTRLMKRCPVICRVDGKAHHSFTRGFNKPFDEIYIKSMQETAKYLCENLQGVVMSYQQSDEITLVFVDYKELNTSPYFDYEVQKLCSIIASMATMVFNKFFNSYASDYCTYQYRQYYYIDDIPMNIRKYCYTLGKAMDKGAMFDARVFNIPKEEVTNCLYWRQLDSIRNSIQMLGRNNFSHKELQNKSCNDIQDMLMKQKGINWNDLPTYQKYGSCCIKEKYHSDDCITRSRWVIDANIPIFIKEGRQYIEKLIMVGK